MNNVFPNLEPAIVTPFFVTWEKGVVAVVTAHKGVGHWMMDNKSREPLASGVVDGFVECGIGLELQDDWVGKVMFLAGLVLPTFLLQSALWEHHVVEAVLF